MWRSAFAVCLVVLAGALTVSGTASAAPSSQVRHVVQPTDTPAPGNETLQPGTTVGPGPAVDAPQEPAPASTDTRKKLWLGGIALLLFALVYWRNKKRWSKWRAGRKG
ncbi:hypothetical protein [Saccharothrix longispora]|uniref:hypothetical protein n=1 Tax=Saccharothrix longispora TaxID=33920 RepID=UPI0028FD7A24|nr:hypothetical protein [Saccharothrix longispora]MBY8850768.1 hypothetical protein [Saccharothrix sp. MB29]MDU0293020.1 hypothetical protein [Saccharothrix longispora]